MKYIFLVFVILVSFYFHAQLQGWGDVSFYDVIGWGVINYPAITLGYMCLMLLCSFLLFYYLKAVLECLFLKATVAFKRDARAGENCRCFVDLKHRLHTPNDSGKPCYAIKTYKKPEVMLANSKGEILKVLTGTTQLLFINPLLMFFAFTTQAILLAKLVGYYLDEYRVGRFELSWPDFDIWLVFPLAYDPSEIGALLLLYTLTLMIVTAIYVVRKSNKVIKRYQA